MPHFRKLSPVEVAALEQPPLSERAAQMLEYDALLADFAPGDYGYVALAEGESRAAVRRRLQAAAMRRSWNLVFRPGTALIFAVEPAPLAPQHHPTAPATERRRDDAPRRAPPPPRRRESSAERYHNLLPRWMREGQASGRRDGGRRRSR